MTKSFAKLSVLLLVLTLGLLWSREAQAQKKVRFAYPSSADMGDIPRCSPGSNSRNKASKSSRRSFRKPTWPCRPWSPEKPTWAPPPASPWSKPSRAA